MHATMRNKQYLAELHHHSCQANSILAMNLTVGISYLFKGHVGWQQLQVNSSAKVNQLEAGLRILQTHEEYKTYRYMLTKSSWAKNRTQLQPVWADPGSRSFAGSHEPDLSFILHIPDQNIFFGLTLQMGWAAKKNLSVIVSKVCIKSETKWERRSGSESKRFRSAPRT